MIISTVFINVISTILLLILPNYSYGIIILSVIYSILSLVILPIDIIWVSNIIIYIMILLILNISEKKKNSISYNINLLIIITGMILSINATNLFILFISIEIISMSLYGILVAYSYEYSSSINYYILGSIMSGVFMLGTGLLFMGINIGYFFIILLLIFKIGAVPLHFIIPELYTRIPKKLIYILSTVYKLNSSIILFRIFDSSLIEFDILIYASILSIIIGSIIPIYKNNIYKILGYSGIFNIGFILLTIITKEVLTFYIYWVIYGIMTILFILLINGNYIYNLNGIYEKNKYYSIVWLILIFSLIGLPPFSGFFIKLMVIYNSIELNQLTIVFLSIFMIIISSAVYLRILKAIFVNKGKEYIIKYNNKFSHIIGILTSIISCVYI